jgi:putative amidase-like protein
MKQFNRSAAAAYALKYAFSYNPEWPSYQGKGGDCTNFVSQALYAGGWTMVQIETSILGSVRDDGSWYSGKAGSGIDDRSWTWAAAANFTRFLASGNGGRAKKCQISELALGDVVQLRDYGIIHHTLIVTGVLPTSIKTPGESGIVRGRSTPFPLAHIPFVTYHTSDVSQKPLTAIHSEDMMCWKISDWFDEKFKLSMAPSMPRVG